MQRAPDMPRCDELALIDSLAMLETDRYRSSVVALAEEAPVAATEVGR